MVRAFIRLTAALLAIVFVTENAVKPSFGQGFMRSQVRTIERAIQRNIEQLMRPKLLVKEGATGPVTGLALSRNERFLVTAVGDNSVRFWDMEEGTELARLFGHEGAILDIAVSEDGNRVVTTSEDLTVRLWPVKEGAASQILLRASNPVRTISMSGKSIIAGDGEGIIYYWSESTERPRTVVGHKGGINRVRFSASGERFVTVGSDGKVIVWDSLTLAKVTVHEKHDHPVVSAALSSDGRVVASGDSDGEVIVWQVKEGAVKKRFDVPGGKVNAVAFDESGSRLATGSDDGSVALWRLDAGGAERIEIGRHDKQVTYVALDKKGEFLLSSGHDGITKLWNAVSKVLLAQIFSTEQGWAIVDADGRFDGDQVAASGIHWEASDASLPMENFTDAYYEPALLPRLMEGGESLATVRSIPGGVHYPPNVSMEESSGEQTVILKIAAEEKGGGGVETVRLYHNGRLVDPSLGKDIEREEANNQAVLRISYETELSPGQNIFNAIAINEEGTESLPARVVIEQPEAKGRGTLHVVTVGINAYKDNRLDLNFAEPDAKALIESLANGKLPFERIDTRLLLNERATQTEILDAVKGLSESSANDVVVMYLAGHGVSLEKDWFFLPHETPYPESEGDLRRWGMAPNTLETQLHRIRAQKLLVIFDACQSGATVGRFQQYKGLKALRRFARTFGVHMLMATEQQQLAVEVKALGHGVLTYALLDGLKGKADNLPADGLVTVKELLKYVEREVPVLSWRHAQYTQTPVTNSRGANFPIVSLR